MDKKASVPLFDESTEAPDRSILEQRVDYEGSGISVRGLETLIDGERSRQNLQVTELVRLRERNTELQRTLGEELLMMRELSEKMLSERREKGVFASLASVLPSRRKATITRISVEQVLRDQYAASAKRVKEAAEFADRLMVAERELFDEIDRLNQRMIESSRNKARAAAFVKALLSFQERVAVSKSELEADSVAALQQQADLDRARRLLAEHATQLQLFHTAVDRLGVLKESTRMLVDTIAGLRGDISQYVMAASEKLDLIAGQIRAIGTAADATTTLVEMKRSLEAMGDSMNQTTCFIAETQRYFRENLDQLLGSLEVYDSQTRASLEVNLELSRAADNHRIERLVQMTLSEGDGAPASLASSAAGRFLQGRTAKKSP